MIGREQESWRRNPMVWLLIAFPLAAVIGGFATLGLAIRSDDGVVVDDYYRRGKEINLVLARDRAARARMLHAVVQPDSEARLHVALTSTSPLPAQIEIQFLHATRQGQDARMLAPRLADGSYRVPLPALVPGRYHLQLAAEDWRLHGSLYVSADARFAALEIAP